ncbi:unnamed protein product, partial [Rotaria magnacalcarata]
MRSKKFFPTTATVAHQLLSNFRS